MISYISLNERCTKLPPPSPLFPVFQGKNARFGKNIDKISPYYRVLFLTFRPIIRLFFKEIFVIFRQKVERVLDHKARFEGTIYFSEKEER